jgi:hypothetical protein
MEWSWLVLGAVRSQEDAQGTESIHSQHPTTLTQGKKDVGACLGPWLSD